jgi:cellulose synthase/poly-beta-1,6-N-acetylglucosamine synthase-like glycosyltransferase
MQILIWILHLIGLLLVAATLPVILELALLTPASFLPRRKCDPRGRYPAFRLAVIIPAHNEESLIGQCVESLRVSAAGTGTRIVVIAHNCSDHTAERASQAGAEVVVYDDPHARGKGFALMRGFEHVFASTTEAVLIVDADSTVSENLIQLTSHALTGGAAVVQCRYELESNASLPKTRLRALAFRGFTLIRAGGRARLGLSAGILGNGFALRREVLEQTPYKALSVVEDLEYHVQLLLSGKRVFFLEEAVVFSHATASASGDITQRARWEGGRAMVARRWIVPLGCRAVSGRPHLAEPLLDLSSLPLGFAALALFVGLCLPLAWLRIYSVSAFAIIGFHVLAAAWKGPDFLEDICSLARVPGYIFWKVSIIPHLLQGSRRNAAWIRTEREAIPGIAPYDQTGRIDLSADSRPNRLAERLPADAVIGLSK